MGFDANIGTTLNSNREGGTLIEPATVANVPLSRDDANRHIAHNRTGRY